MPSPEFYRSEADRLRAEASKGKGAEVSRLLRLATEYDQLADSMNHKIGEAKAALAGGLITWSWLLALSRLELCGTPPSFLADAVGSGLRLGFARFHAVSRD